MRPAIIRALPIPASAPRRTLFPSLSLLFLVFALVLGPFPATSRATTQTAFGDRVFAPYVDVLTWPPFSLQDIYEKTGQKHFTLAFVVSGPAGEPSWGGVRAMEEDWYKDQINYIRGQGGDVILSFGGANGTELALAHSTVAGLQAAYQAVIDRYEVKWVDFDIEGMAVAHRPSIDLRNRAITALQAANPDLKVAFCLPVLPQGLTADGLFVLENARNHGVRIDLVNVMAMDYGDYPAPDPEGKMGQYAIDAAQNTFAQMQALGIDAQIGVTPMIGQNDVISERFYLSDAQQVLDWANDPQWQDRVGMLSMWSANRDNGTCPGGPAQAGCSGIEQGEFAFTSLLGAFTQAGGNALPSVAVTSPLDQAVFPEGADVTLTAQANDPDGQVVRVEFFLDSLPLGQDLSEPFGLVVQGVETGSYILTATAYDNEGASKTSGPVRIFVGTVCTASDWNASTVYWGGDRASLGGHQWEAKWWTRGEQPGTTGMWGVWKDLGSCGGNADPLVVLTSPAQGAVFEATDSLTLAADAQDTDGSIVRVEFFDGAASLGVDQSAPYGLTLTGLAPGNHNLKAKATDNEGATAVSQVVSITIQDESGSTGGACDQPAWDPGQNWTTYTVGDQRTHDGKLWECVNTAFSYWEPSGPYGMYGWSFIRDCD